MKTTNSILLVPKIYVNAKDFSEKVHKTTFKNISGLTNMFYELVKDDNTIHTNLVEVMEMDEFITKVNNSLINLDNFFISNIFFIRV